MDIQKTHAKGSCYKSHAGGACKKTFKEKPARNPLLQILGNDISAKPKIDIQKTHAEGACYKSHAGGACKKTFAREPKIDIQKSHAGVPSRNPMLEVPARNPLLEMPARKPLLEMPARKPLQDMPARNLLLQIFGNLCFCVLNKALKIDKEIPCWESILMYTLVCEIVKL
ncbi:hypothetical protein BgiBS90_023155 [Biomphalaria glabrata]|nr:hypothetical protein BgiBS90_023155 [Biomphalaria glabrata]